MSKNNNLQAELILVRKCYVLKLAFDEFKKAIKETKIFNSSNETLFKLTLDNLLNEIKTATEVIKEKNKQ